MGDNDEIFDTPLAAAFIKKPVRTLEAWRYKGVGPPYIRYNSRTVRYRKSDLIAFLDRCTVTPLENVAHPAGA